MQNEPNFPDDQMNVNKVLTRDYGNIASSILGENEPKTNPIYPAVASGEAGTNPIYPALASGEAGSNPISAFNHVKLRNLCEIPPRGVPLGTTAPF